MNRPKAFELRARFEAAGATIVEPPVLQPAETLLDLYGEDIRARAYVTSDALRGEQMLRPDFTVPVVQMHMAEGAEPARYTYAGKIFRRQEEDPDRANEYFQVGFEVFDRTNPAAADAEVFAAIHDCVKHLTVEAATGDIGILLAAVKGLKTSERRKAALLRHIWRPRRFRALLDRFSGRTPVPSARKALLSGTRSGAPMIGLRSAAEIAARIEALRDDAEEGPISAYEMEAIDTLLTVRETLPFALDRLKDLTVDFHSIAGAVETFAKRTSALLDAGIDIDALMFEASYGRTSLEYYDGFVFGFSATERPDLPLVATGGRYDALTRRLGMGAEIPAVGGVLRPDLIAMLEAS
ncbi:MAG: ATP phosphoribosyltransferase regulatory subunit [Paracoccaceae bacterium]